MFSSNLLIHNKRKASSFLVSIFIFLTHCLTAWYQAATELGHEFWEDQTKGSVWVQRALFCPPNLNTQNLPMVVKPQRVVEPSMSTPSRPPLTCFHCGKPGHRTAKCTDVEQKKSARTPGARTMVAKKSIKATPEKLRGLNKRYP